MEAFSSHAEGTLTVIKELSPTSFVVEQNLATMPSAKTLTLDSKTNHIFLIAAAFDPPPPGTPPPSNGRVARGPMVAGSFSILAVGKWNAQGKIWRWQYCQPGLNLSPLR